MAREIYDILKEQHDEARKLLDQLAASSADANGVKLRREEGTKVAIELITHHEAESRTLYQRLMDFNDIRDHVEEHQGEHEEANAALKELLDTDLEDETWLEQLKEIKGDVEHHIEDEEESLFPEARERLDQAEAEEIGEKFIEVQDERKQKLKARRAAA
jgi:hypothetical protein